MSDEPTIEDLRLSLNDSKAFEGSLLQLALWQEYRFRRAVVEADPKLVNLVPAERNRTAARAAVEFVICFFHDRFRTEMEKMKEELIEKVLSWASKHKTILN
jgi:hypothetical protein